MKSWILSHSHKRDRDKGTKGVESDVLCASSAYLTFVIVIGAQCNMYTCMGKVPGGYGATGGTTNMAKAE